MTILKTSPTLPKADVAELAGVDVRTVQRVKRELNGSNGHDAGSPA